jgi:CheY-like chemotaxis protein
MSSLLERKIARPFDDKIIPKSSYRRALVVGGDETVTTVVCQVLKSFKFDVSSTKGGFAAMHLLNQSNYDLVITDLQIPDFDGYALAGWLKQKSENTKAIVMTGFGNSEVLNHINSHVVDGWIFKPFSQIELIGMLHKYFPQQIELLSHSPINP